MKTVIKEIIESALDKAKRAGQLELGNAPDVVIEKPKDEKSEKKEDMTKLSVAALKDLAKSKGISGISKMKKADLIKALS